MTRAQTQCDQCGQVDDHPKWHYSTATYHHDCAPYTVIRDITTTGYWEPVDLLDPRQGLRWVEGEEVSKADMPKALAEALAIRRFAEEGLRGLELAERITSGKAI